MLDLEVDPPKSQVKSCSWELTLGMPLSHCISIFQQSDKEIKRVQVWYSNQTPLDKDLILNLPEDGIRLLFDSYSQRLKIIEVFDMDKVILKYCGEEFNAPTVPPTEDQITRSFGPTIINKFDASKQVLLKQYQGLTFWIPVDNPQSSPLQDTDYRIIQNVPGIVPKVSRMSIYRGDSVTDCQVPAIPLHCYNNNCILDKLEVNRLNGVTTSLNLQMRIPVADREEVIERELVFGLSCQEISSRLGSPTQIFYKAEDKMKIHSHDVDKKISNPHSDYIYNYFSMGLDIVFDGTVHTAKKFILHTNMPGHYNFNIYMRCLFTISLTQESTVEHRMSNPYQLDQVTVTPFTKWTDVEQVCYRSSADRRKPVILERTSSVNSVNPFGPTFCHGIQDMIFEVMKNKHIASIIIYQLPV